MIDEIRSELKVPPPSPYHPHDLVDEIATRLSQRYRNANTSLRDRKLELNTFLKFIGVDLHFEFIEEPEGAHIFGSYSEDDGLPIITINEKHGDFFEDYPRVLRHTIAHEIGHFVLGHARFNAPPSGTLSLFSEEENRDRIFHRASWPYYGMDKESYLKLKALNQRAITVLSKRASVDEDARNSLYALTSKFEPEWMFWQAEHFSLCLQVPRDYLNQELERPIDLTSWSTFYQLGDKYGVTASMVKTRLRKLGVVNIASDGTISIVDNTQRKLL